MAQFVQKKGILGDPSVYCDTKRKYIYIYIPEAFDLAEEAYIAIYTHLTSFYVHTF